MEAIFKKLMALILSMCLTFAGIPVDSSNLEGVVNDLIEMTEGSDDIGSILENITEYTQNLMNIGAEQETNEETNETENLFEEIGENLDENVYEVVEDVLQGVINSPIEMYTEEEYAQDTYTAVEKVMYVIKETELRCGPSNQYAFLNETLKPGQSITVEAVCNETGWYRFQSGFRQAYVDPECLSETKEVAEVHNHNYVKNIIKNATCTENGEIAFVCECGDSYTENITATGHKWSGYSYNNNATYTSNGTETKTCEYCGKTESRTAEGTKLQYTYAAISQKMYATSNVNVRKGPSTDFEKIGSLTLGQEVTVSNKCNETGWYQISYNGTDAYVSNSYLTTEKPVVNPLNIKYKYSFNYESGCLDASILNDMVLSIYNGTDKTYEIGEMSYRYTEAIRAMLIYGNRLDGFRNYYSGTGLVFSKIEGQEALNCINSRRDISGTVESALKSILNENMSDYQKAQAIAKYVYDYKAVEDQSSVTQMLDTGKGNCMAHAILFKIMCNSAGLQCRYVSGWKGEAGHAWNEVCVNGTWYGVDTNWYSGLHNLSSFNTDHKNKYSADRVILN